jgi:hypothetical protein
MPEATKPKPIVPDNPFVQAAHPRTVTTAEELVNAIADICKDRADTLLGSPLQLTLIARQLTPGSREFRLAVAIPKIFSGEI